MTLLTQAPRNLGFLLAEAEGQRSRETGTLKQGAQILPPGTLVDGDWTVASPVLHKPATDADDVTGILSYWADPTAGNVAAPFIVRDAEVNEAYLIYGDLDRKAVADALAASGIIVRTGVLGAPGNTFGVPAATDPALADSVYGPDGVDALDPGGIYGRSAAAAMAAPTRVERPEVLDLPDGRSTPLVTSRLDPAESAGAKDVPPEGRTRTVDDVGTLPGKDAPPTGEEVPPVPAVGRPVPGDAPSQSAQRTDRPKPPAP